LRALASRLALVGTGIGISLLAALPGAATQAAPHAVAASHQVLPRPPLPAGFGYAVTCMTRSGCVAVGGDTASARAAFWDGAAWKKSQPESPSGQPDPGLRDVSCYPQGTTSGCVAVGTTSGGDAERMFADIWAMDRWVLRTPGWNHGMSSLTSVSCPASQDCWAVGSSGSDLSNYGTLIEHWDGNRWTRTDSPHPYPVPRPGGDYDLQSVSCPTRSFCVAVGGISGGLIEHRNGGRWHDDQPHGKSPSCTSSRCVYGPQLFSVSCVSTKFCMAVGNDSASAAAVKWNGSEWSGVPVPAGERLEHIACESRTSCYASGYRRYNGRTYPPVIEHWNGTKWRVVSPSVPKGDVLVICDPYRHCNALR